MSSQPPTSLCSTMVPRPCIKIMVPRPRGCRTPPPSWPDRGGQSQEKSGCCLITWHDKLDLPPLQIISTSCLLCFGAGVLLSTSLLHMLPEVQVVFIIVAVKNTMSSSVWEINVRQIIIIANGINSQTPKLQRALAWVLNELERNSKKGKSSKYNS